MQDQYAYLRGQYEEIVEHCEYLLRNSIDPGIRAKAQDSMQKAMTQLARLNRQLTGIPETNA